MSEIDTIDINTKGAFEWDITEWVKKKPEKTIFLIKCFPEKDLIQISTE